MAKTKAERLAQQRLCKRRKYLEIKNDPELYALEKEKQRAKYRKRKEEKKQKSITEKSPREQRKLRKQWKENSKKYRQRKKEQVSSVIPNVINVEADGISENVTHPIDDPICLFTKEEMQKAERKVRYQELKKRIRLITIIKNLQKINKNQRMKISRLKAMFNKSHNSDKENEGNGQNLTRRKKPINRRHNAISNLRSRKDTKFRLLRKQVIESIEIFYNDDTVSTISAGKKEFITKNKRRMQKRYLTAPLKVLHKRFITETNFKVSYSFFTKHRPFWVLYPKLSGRDTCLCAQHTNIELLIKALCNASIIGVKNSHELVSVLCCEPRNPSCLLRECNSCKNKNINYREFSNDSNLTYFKWRKASKEVVTKKGLKQNKVLTVKDRITTNPLEAIKELESVIKPFLLHIHNIESQYKTIKQLKENLTVSEAILHIDFSENYSLKYAEEVQSFHFGGSRQQVSLHTSVIYTHDFSLGAVRPISVCTISKCVRHDVAAIWAHLIPLIKQAIEINPFITTLHFQSDSPVSQYRNKYMFYVISQIRTDFEYVSRITWNYTEAGHGKGAPDGVGAVLKRTADKIINYGQDIGDFETFYTVIKENVENIIIINVTENAVKEKENLIPKNLKPFRGTLSVHQVLWDVFSTKLTLRKVSCFFCNIDERCVHGKHLGFYDISQNVKKNYYSSENVVTLDETAPKRNNSNKKIVVLEDITFKTQNELNLHFKNRPGTSKSSQNVNK